MSAIVSAKPEVVYPDSDGQPMADNTLQFEWISTLMWNLEIQYRGDPNVFVAGDHLIYPVEGDATIRLAPDVYVAFGRPKGHRGSYKVFEEDGVFPQVVFEVWSPNNRFRQMQSKLAFYERYGAEEYYILYPEFPAEVDAWIRRGDRLVEIEDANGHRSDRLGIRFELKKGNVTVYGRNDERFLTPVEIAESRDRERERADEARRLADEARKQADTEQQKAEKLAAKLRELGIDPDTV